MAKAKDELGGRISADGGVRREFSAEDVGRLEHGAARAEAILKHARARHVFRQGIVAAHPGGSARVGDDVDANLKTAYDNLYVCDCSVIPGPRGLPSTFARLAHGRRFAKHLIGRSVSRTTVGEMEALHLRCEPATGTRIASRPAELCIGCGACTQVPLFPIWHRVDTERRDPGAIQVALSKDPKRPSQRLSNVPERVTSLVVRTFDGAATPVSENSGCLGRSGTSPTSWARPALAADQREQEIDPGGMRPQHHGGPPLDCGWISRRATMIRSGGNG